MAKNRRKRPATAAIAQRLEHVRENVARLTFSEWRRHLESAGYAASYAGIQNWHSGERVPPADYVAQIAELFPTVDRDWLLTGNIAKDEMSPAEEAFFDALHASGVFGLESAVMVSEPARAASAALRQDVESVAVEDAKYVEDARAIQAEIARRVARAIAAPLRELAIQPGATVRLPQGRSFSGTQFEQYVIGIAAALRMLFRARQSKEAFGPQSIADFLGGDNGEA